MFVVAISQHSGIFSWLNVQIAKKSKGSPLAVFLLFSALTFFTSTVLNNATVVLLIIIDQNGRVSVDKVVESSVREFEQAAITAAEQCVFEPPMKGGQPVRARYRMQVPFRL